MIRILLLFRRLADTHIIFVLRQNTSSKANACIFIENADQSLNNPLNFRVVFFSSHFLTQAAPSYSFYDAFETNMDVADCSFKSYSNSSNFVYKRILHCDFNTAHYLMIMPKLQYYDLVNYDNQKRPNVRKS